MLPRILIVPAIFIPLLSGCTTNWKHPQISDPTYAKRQLTIDDTYCTQASYGSVPMPQVHYNNVYSGSTNFTASGSSFNAKNGTTYNQYHGVVTTIPSPANAFTGGMANGMNFGMAFSAAQAREKIYKGCMYNLGWID
ncbi:hypothetical protein [Halotalea alkalilenta]|uniref:hypothetical protein n=1 Tax=Halotalea alkalilenta TaxID=376489 RepID=UPI0012372895|nr:hypothetical protein [Halotalea alkalilenta]